MKAAAAALAVLTPRLALLVERAECLRFPFPPSPSSAAFVCFPSICQSKAATPIAKCCQLLSSSTLMRQTEWKEEEEENQTGKATSRPTNNSEKELGGSNGLQTLTTPKKKVFNLVKSCKVFFVFYCKTFFVYCPQSLLKSLAAASRAQRVWPAVWFAVFTFSVFLPPSFMFVFIFQLV